MTTQPVAKASITIHAPAKDVWNALVDPEVIARYMFGARVVTDWRPGSPITWTGEWQGRPFVDRGVILEVDPEKALVYSHYSPMSGLPDRPENHHKITIWLVSDDEHTRVSLHQEGCAGLQDYEHSESYWEKMLAGLKEQVEAGVEDRRSGSAGS